MIGTDILIASLTAERDRLAYQLELAKDIIGHERLKPSDKLDFSIILTEDGTEALRLLRLALHGEGR